MARGVKVTRQEAWQRQGGFRHALAVLHRSGITFRHRGSHHINRFKRSIRDKHKAPAFGTGAEGGRLGKSS